MTYILQFDGCCVPNPGNIGIGVVVRTDEGKQVLEVSEQSGFGTNNQAEYKALIKGLEELSKIYSGKLLVRGDSQLIINQLKDDWKVKKEELIPLYAEVKLLESRFQKIEYEWISRNENKEADRLSAKALDLDMGKREEKKVHLQIGCSYEFVFDDDNRIVKVRNKRYNKENLRFYVKSAIKDGKKIPGTYFETGSKKLVELLNFMKPLTNKKLRIIPTKAQNWTDYMVEEIEN
jgi:ribonuclease HI